MTSTRTIRVELGARSYDVTVGTGLLHQAGELLRASARSGRVALITDANVGSLYGPALSEVLERAGCQVNRLEMPAGEAHKDLRTYGDVMNRLLGLSPPIDRRTLIVALGGGVVGDLGGFVAATALRGLSFVNVPTTLLADVDASVGGKTGLDAPYGKNLIGAFHQPRAVIIDAALLATLPAGELQNGLAECVKHAVIADQSLLEFIEVAAGPILACQADVLAELIARNVAIKAEVVSSDERESGRRAHLNFGHTLGHALETAAGYGRVSHGQAVSLGMAAALELAVGRGLIPPAAAERIKVLLSRLKLPVRFADLPELPPAARDPAGLGEIMRRDKKARAGAVRFILPTRIGAVAFCDDLTGAEISAAIAALDR